MSAADFDAPPSIKLREANNNLKLVHPEKPW